MNHISFCLNTEDYKKMSSSLPANAMNYDVISSVRNEWCMMWHDIVIYNLNTTQYLLSIKNTHWNTQVHITPIIYRNKLDLYLKNTVDPILLYIKVFYLKSSNDGDHTY